MEIGRIQQNSQNTNFKAKIKYNRVIKSLRYCNTEDLLPRESKIIGKSNDIVEFNLSTATRKGDNSFTRILSVKADLFDGNKINWSRKLSFADKRLDVHDCFKVVRNIQNYTQSLVYESNKIKENIAKELAKKPFAKFSVTDPGSWGYISDGKSFDSLNMMHFIADFANRAEKEIENGTDVSVAKSIALEQLKQEKKYDFGAIDFSTVNKVLESVWKYGKLI